jgi:hypothetical protein
MILSELIDKLKELPQDAQVKILAENTEYSDFYTSIKYFNMDDDHIHFDKQKNILQLGG